MFILISFPIIVLELCNTFKEHDLWILRFYPNVGKEIKEDW